MSVHKRVVVPLVNRIGPEVGGAGMVFLFKYLYLNLRKKFGAPPMHKFIAPAVYDIIQEDDQIPKVFWKKL